MVEGKSINTLYISYDGMTDPLGQSQVLPYLKGLTASGYKISLISFEKEEQKDRMPYIKQLIKDIGIDWYPLPYTKRPPIISTLWDIRQMRKLAFKLHKAKSFKLVHCRSYISAMIGLEMKQKFGTKLLFDMRGFYADERVDGKIWNLENPIFKRVYDFFKKKEKQFFQQADYTISLTHNGKQIIEDWNINAAPITVIPCCVDLDLFQSNGHEPTADVTGKSLTIGYLGGIGTWYMLPEMLDFFKELLTVYPDAVFHFITREQPETILNLALEKEIKINHFKIEAANREEIPDKIKTWDCSIFFIKPVFSKQASSPTKQGEIMAMGIPIICNSGVGDTDYVIENYRAGALVKEFNSENYQEVINRIEEVLQLPTQNMINGAQEFYSLAEGVKRYESVYEEVLNEC